MLGDPWKDWKPGNPRAAKLVKGKDWIFKTLDRHKLEIPELKSIDIIELGEVASQALSKGLGTNQFARLLEDKISNPLLHGTDGLSLTLALVLCSAAQNAASYQDMLENGVEEVEWFGHGICVECLKNNGQRVKIGSPFASGHLFPPACTNCFCSLSPVMPDFS